MWRTPLGLTEEILLFVVGACLLAVGVLLFESAGVKVIREPIADSTLEQTIIAERDTIIMLRRSCVGVDDSTWLKSLTWEPK